MRGEHASTGRRAYALVLHQKVGRRAFHLNLHVNAMYFCVVIHSFLQTIGTFPTNPTTYNYVCRYYVWPDCC